MRPECKAAAFLLVLTTLGARPALAAGCALAAGEKLVVGCTFECPKTYTDALSQAAKNAGYAIEVCAIGSNRADGKSCGLSDVDAVVSPGGGDPDLSHYLDAFSPSERARARKVFANTVSTSEKSRARDDRELALLDSYFSDASNADLPYLGVCYGMQMMAIHSHLPLVIDLETQLGIPDRDGPDTIHVSPATKFSSIMGRSVFTGEESHHQGIDPRVVAALHRKDLRVTASSHSGRLAEALEFDGRPAIGVQFHPERSEDVVSNRVYGWLLKKGCERHTRASTAGAPGKMSELIRALDPAELSCSQEGG